MTRALGISQHQAQVLLRAAEADAERIIRTHYLAGDLAIDKIEAGTKL